MVHKPSVIEYLETGLQVTTLRQKVGANNIANLQTPGFRRKSVSFEDALAKAMDRPGGATHDDLARVKPDVFLPMNTPVNRHGNDVNLEVEMGEILKASSRHKTFLRLLNKQYKMMEAAIQNAP